MAKTVRVSSLVEDINFYLANSLGDDEKARYARNSMICMLVSILHETGNYRGFTYLTEGQTTAGVKPGIRWIDNNPNFEDTDDTRVRYA